MTIFKGLFFQVILGVFLFGQLEFEEKGEGVIVKTKRVLKVGNVNVFLYLEFIGQINFQLIF